MADSLEPFSSIPHSLTAPNTSRTTVFTGTLLGRSSARSLYSIRVLILGGFYMTPHTPCLLIPGRSLFYLALCQAKRGGASRGLEGGWQDGCRSDRAMGNFMCPCALLGEGCLHVFLTTVQRGTPGHGARPGQASQPIVAPSPADR